MTSSEGQEIFPAYNHGFQVDMRHLRREFLLQILAKGRDLLVLASEICLYHILLHYNKLQEKILSNILVLHNLVPRDQTRFKVNEIILDKQQIGYDHSQE